MHDTRQHDSLPMPDGRILHLFGPWSGQPAWPHLTQPKQCDTAHQRWHPVRQEWVTYAAARQNRTYKPAANACPLCPKSPDGELPLDDFTLAVFENRFPSFQVQNGAAPDLTSLGLETRPAKGACEVVVYCSAHAGNLATIPAANRELLIDVWGRRRRDLLQTPDIDFVMPFENRGEDAGVTLHHPHGQIYAFRDLPPVVEKITAAFKGGFNLQQALKSYGPQVIFETETAVSFVPPYARYPYEIWLTTKAFHPASDELSPAERADIADLLRRTILLYDRFFGRQCPYIMPVYMAPKGCESIFPFHIQFYPLLRSADRMKYLAGCEQGAGAFLVDILPENAAASLREIGKGIS